jgi:uncharacterized membrane protein YfcA
MTLNELIIVLAIGLTAGFLSGSMGIGGAIIVIPSLMFFLGFSTQQAQGTSLALMTIPVMLVSAINYYQAGKVNIKIALIMSITFIIGGYIGSKLSVNLPEKVIRKAFAVLLLAVSIKMFLGK